MRSEFISYYEHDGKDGYLEIDMCPVCKYVYKVFTPKEWGANKVIFKGSLPFIDLLEPELIKDEYDKVDRRNKYACPKCGVIQLVVEGDFPDEQTD